MKVIDNVEYFDIHEISERLNKEIRAEEIREYFEKGKIIGKKIENEWYGDQNAITDLTIELKGKFIEF
jgi:hypothetical protein